MKSELFRSELLLTRRFENIQRDVSQELFFCCKSRKFYEILCQEAAKATGGNSPSSSKRNAVFGGDSDAVDISWKRSESVISPLARFFTVSEWEISGCSTLVFSSSTSSAIEPG